MKRIVLALLTICILLSGCNTLTNGEFIWTQRHSMPKSPNVSQNVSAANYEQLHALIVDMVESGTTQIKISVDRYDRSAIETDVKTAIGDISTNHPVAAYAVKSVRYTLGSGGGENVLVLDISYLHGQQEIKKIKKVANTAEAEMAVAAALTALEPGIVLQIENYTPIYFSQMVADYAMTHPQRVMEVPTVTQNVYPEEGRTRVVELQFGYTVSLDSLQNMRSQVEPIFDAAVLYISGEGVAYEKFSQLYTFLMRFFYRQETSITPAYSLLRHGVGDSKAYATVYTAICHSAGLACMTVSGTRAGERWYWNMVQVDGMYYHLDLLECSHSGGFSVYDDSQMTGYVWDYDAYPVSVRPQPEPTEPPETNPAE